MDTPSFRAKCAAVLHRIFLFFFYLLLRSTVGLYCRIRYRVRYHRPREVRRLRTPYVVLADHVHIMDMFFIGLGLRPVIHWVAADANFRTPFMKFVMTFLAGAVAKSKNRSDMITLSRMKLLTDIGSVIGIYQEGERSWDGVSLPPVPGTDKLIRFLKVPVVYAHLEGAFLNHPRWSWKSNRNRVNVRYELVIDRNEVKNMPLSEITDRIGRAGTYNEWEYQKKAALPLGTDTRAEHLELVCFLCPKCRSVNTLVSQGNTFSCSACGMNGVVDSFGSLVWHDEPEAWPQGKPFENIRMWNLWQIDYYRRVVAELYPEPIEAGTDASVSSDYASARGDTAHTPPAARSAGDVLLGDHLFWEDANTVYLSRGRRNRRMKNLGLGTARFFGDRIEYESSEINLVMPLDTISSFSVFKQYYVEFYHNRVLYRFAFANRSVSGYKWLMLFRIILERISRIKNGG